MARQQILRNRTIAQRVLTLRACRIQSFTTTPTSRSTNTTTTTTSKNTQITQQQQLHSSVPQPAIVVQPTPSFQALKTLFITSAIPMIGFGFMDNVVMIQAGQYIDSTIGVRFGLATLTAAACGQVVSDVSGVVFGGTLERFLTKIALIKPPDLSIKQREMSICRNVSMLGAVVGVIAGCILGATTLLFIDLKARDRIHRAMQLRDIVADMITLASSTANGNTLVSDGDVELPCDTAIVYLVCDGDNKSSHHFDLQQTQIRDNKVLLRELPITTKASKTTSTASDALFLPQQCCRTKQVVWDESRQYLCAPICNSENQAVAVIEWHYNKAATNDGTGFTQEHVKAAKYAARHIAIFMEHLAK